MASNFEPYFQQYGNAFGVSPTLLHNVAQLESSMNPSVVNRWDSNAAAGTPSAGLMQFIEPTFNSFYDRARAANPAVFRELGQKDWMDPRQQIATAAWAMGSGLGSHWATYGRAGGSRLPSVSAVESPAASGAAMGSPSTNKHLALANVYAARGQAGPEYTRRFSSVSPAGSWTGLSTAEQSPWSAQVAAPSPFFERLRKRFGLRNDPGTGQTTGGKHAAGSLHYAGRAIDFGNALNNPALLTSVAQWAKQRPEMFSELYYDPLGWYIKNGQVMQGSIGGHGDHLHIGV